MDFKLIMKVINVQCFSGLGGIWKLKLLPEANPGPYSITARSTEGEITINDVMFGDVWICSGQSNMQFTMKQVLFVLLYTCTQSMYIRN